MSSLTHVVAAVGVLAQTTTDTHEQAGTTVGLQILLRAGPLVVIAALVTWRQARRRNIASIAAAAGLGYASDDPFGCARGPLPYLQRGDRRDVTSVLWRVAPDPHHTKVFELRIVNDHQLLEPGASPDTEIGRGSTCCTAVVNAAFPYLSVGPKKLVDDVRDLVRGDPIDLESEEFNEAFDVRSPDRRFAVAFLDARMQQLLLESMQGFELEVQGAWLLVHSKPLPPKALPGLFVLMDRIVDTIPSVLSSLYPAPFGPDIHAELPDPYATRTLRIGLNSGLTRAMLEEAAADGPPRPEYDLDGHVVEPHQENPWGPGRPLH